jgi:hypothetical protein
MHADKIKIQTLGCPTLDQLKKAPLDKGEGSLELTMYAIANECVVISKDDKVEALGYDPRNSKDIFQKISYEKTETILYIKKTAITVEKGGKKGFIRF